MTEKDFTNKIDCKFPYSDISLRNELIDQAFTISENSVFAIINELARIPKSQIEKISRIELLEILEQINIRLHHPLKEKVICTAINMIYNKDLTINEALTIMNEIEKFTGQWSALNLIYFSCDDTEGKIEERYNEIGTNWKKQRHHNKSA